MNKQATRVTRRTIEGDVRPIRTVTLTNTRDTAPGLRVVWGKAVLAGATVVRPLLERFVAAAEAEGQNVSITAFDSPRLGSSRYTHDYQAEMLERVILDRVDRTDTPVMAIGHSSMFPGTLKVAAGRPQYVRALIGYTPIGLRGDGEPVGYGEVAGCALEEAMYSDITKPNVARLGVLGGLGINLVRGLAARSGRAEIRRSFDADSLVEVKAVKQSAGLPVGIMAGEHDAFFCPSDDVRRSLAEADIPMHMFGATHLSAVVDSHHGEELYAFASTIARG